MGSIGLEMAKRARGFDMRILYHSRTRKPEAEKLYDIQFVPMPTRCFPSPTSSASTFP